ncbi:hypothetical protein DFH29DRAFT_530980 [Suillus ampliporus]|nr:hypothetical protein DFH29DRAFT_530980 [Suillus ampliporus]
MISADPTAPPTTLIPSSHEHHIRHEDGMKYVLAKPYTRIFVGPALLRFFPLRQSREEAKQGQSRRPTVGFCVDEMPTDRQRQLLDQWAVNALGVLNIRSSDLQYNQPEWIINASSILKAPRHDMILLVHQLGTIHIILTNDFSFMQVWAGLGGFLTKSVPQRKFSCCLQSNECQDIKYYTLLPVNKCACSWKAFLRSAHLPTVPITKDTYTEI